MSPTKRSGRAISMENKLVNGIPSKEMQSLKNHKQKNIQKVHKVHPTQGRTQSCRQSKASRRKNQQRSKLEMAHKLHICKSDQPC